MTVAASAPDRGHDHRPDHRRGRRTARTSRSGASAPDDPDAHGPRAIAPARAAHGGRWAGRRRRRVRGRPGCEAIVEGLASYEGVGRRFELKGDVGGVVVLDDYAHHPTAIRATFQAARLRYPGRRLWAVYEPLTYHRTAAMIDDVRTGPRARPMPSPSSISGPSGIRTRRSHRPPHWPRRRPLAADRTADRARLTGTDRGYPGRAGATGRRRPGDGRRPLLRGCRSARRTASRASGRSSAGSRSRSEHAR